MCSAEASGKNTWREEIKFETQDQQQATDTEIQKFLAAEGNGVGCPSLPTWDAFLADAKTGIPSDADFEPPPAEPAPHIKAETERAVHPEHYGKEYDSLYAIAYKNVQKGASEWPKNKSRHEISLAKAENHPLCGQVIHNMKALMAHAEVNFKKVEATYKSMEVKGKGYHSMTELQAASKVCEELYQQNKDLQELVKALDSLSKLQVPQKSSDTQ